MLGEEFGGEDLDDARREADRLDAEFAGLRDRRAATLRDLARKLLPGLSEEAIAAAPGRVRADLAAILARRDARRAERAARLEEAETEARRIEAEAVDLPRRIEEEDELRRRLASRVAEILKDQADYQALAKLADEAGAKLKLDEGRAEALAREAAEKLPPYDRSRLFRYLHDRGFDTLEYHAPGWVRAVDRRVADLIDYPRARQGYEFLKAAPGLVAAEVARRRGVAAGLREQARAIEEAEAEKAGLTASAAKLGGLRQERDRVEGEVARLREAATGFRSEVDKLSRPGDAFHLEAVERLRSALEVTDLPALRTLARGIPGAADDEAVDALAGLDREIRAIGPRRDEVGNRRQAADRLHDELDRLLGRFRRAEFDSDRSYFDADDLGRTVARFEAGEGDGVALWHAIEAAQNFRPRPAAAPDPGGTWAANAPIVFGSTPAHDPGPAWSPPPVNASPPAAPPTFDSPSPPTDGGFSSGGGF